MKLLIAFAATIVAVNGGPDSAGISFGSDDLLADLKARALEQWHAGREACRATQGSWISNTSTSRDDATRTEEVTYKSNAPAALLIVQSTSSERSVGEVFGVNSQYAFLLARRTVQSPWVLLNSNGLEDSTLVGRVETMHDRHDPNRLIFGVWAKDLTQMVDDPAFRVLSITERTVAGLRQAQVAFRYERSSGIGNDSQDMVQEGEIFLLPDRYWCLRYARLKMKSATAEGTYELTVETRTSKDGFPIPIRAVRKEDWKSFGGDNPFSLSRQVDFDLEIPEVPPPLEDFTLSAFGLPEIHREFEEPVSWYLWAMLGGFGCLTAMGGYAWWRKRAAM